MMKIELAIKDLDLNMCMICVCILKIVKTLTNKSSFLKMD